MKAKEKHFNYTIIIFFGRYVPRSLQTHAYVFRRTYDTYTVRLERNLWTLPQWTLRPIQQMKGRLKFHFIMQYQTGIKPKADRDIRPLDSNIPSATFHRTPREFFHHTKDNSTPYTPRILRVSGLQGCPPQCGRCRSDVSFMQPCGAILRSQSRACARTMRLRPLGAPGWRGWAEAAAAWACEGLRYGGIRTDAVRPRDYVWILMILGMLHPRGGVGSIRAENWVLKNVSCLFWVASKSTPMDYC